MAKDRARRRAEREAAAAEERRRRQAARRRAEKRDAVVGTVTAPLSRTSSRLSRWWRRTYPKNDPFARRRRRQTLVVLGIVALVQLITWLASGSWALRASVLVLSLLLVPVLRTLLFDRR